MGKRQFFALYPEKKTEVGTAFIASAQPAQPLPHRCK